MNTKIIEAIKTMCEPLVERKDLLDVREVKQEDDQVMVISVTADKEDVARLIGKQGVVAQSVRQLARILTPSREFKLSINFEAHN